MRGRNIPVLPVVIPVCSAELTIQEIRQSVLGQAHCAADTIDVVNGRCRWSGYLLIPFCMCMSLTRIGSRQFSSHLFGVIY